MIFPFTYNVLFSLVFNPRSHEKFSSAGLVFEKFGSEIIKALMRRDMYPTFSVEQLKRLEEKFYNFFIAEFDARYKDLPIDPKLSPNYLEYIVDEIVKAVKARDPENSFEIDQGEICELLGQYMATTSVVTAPVTQSHANIYAHVQNVMRQQGGFTGLDLSVKDLDSFITGCFSIVVSKLIRQKRFDWAVLTMNENRSPSVSTENLKTGAYTLPYNVPMLLCAENRILYIKNRMKFSEYLHETEGFESVLYIVHPKSAADGLWYVRAMPISSTSYTARKPIESKVKTLAAFKSVSDSIGHVARNGHMATVRGVENALKLAALLVDYQPARS